MTEDQVGAIVVGTLSALLGPLVWWITASAATGRLTKNYFVGLRTSHTLASEEAWLTGHRAALPWARRTALAATVLGAAALGVATLGPWQLAVVFAFAGLASVLVGSLYAAWVAHRSTPPA